MTTSTKQFAWFSEDGTYGGGVPLVVDTTHWTKEDWRDIDDTSDNERLSLALAISKKYKES